MHLQVSPVPRLWWCEVLFGLYFQHAGGQADVSFTNPQSINHSKDLTKILCMDTFFAAPNFLDPISVSHSWTYRTSAPLSMWRIEAFTQLDFFSYISIYTCMYDSHLRSACTHTQAHRNTKICIHSLPESEHHWSSTLHCSVIKYCLSDTRTTSWWSMR